MAAKLANTAIIAGASIGGLSAAAALSRQFANVILLDRDELADHMNVRLGASQGAHIHQLLKAGELALEGLLPGITQEFVAAGAKEMLVGRDVKVFDFGGWMDECDAGFTVTSLSRPAYEAILRRRVAALPGVSIRPKTIVKRFIVENGRCAGVELEDGEKLTADLCVDATGMTGPLMKQLAEDGHTAFETEDVKINVAYSTAKFRQKPEHRGEGVGFFFLPGPPGKQFGFMLPIENDQWVLSVGARGSDQPPKTIEQIREYAKAFDPKVYERIDGAEPTTGIKTFRKPTATRRRVWESRQWPDRLIPIGDTMSSVNPTYGQGMTVAACEAEALGGMLDRRVAEGAGLDGIAAEYLPVAAQIAERAWGLSINSDYVYPETEGERPPTFAMTRAMVATLRKLADEDMDFRIARYRLVHMVDSANALREGPLAIRFFTALQGSMAS
jgi:2-polyprenyl-6-methoxyphenol hydroxylase-like FAD-dependent oxidoreductase